MDKLEQKLILSKIEQENYIDTGYPVWNLYVALFLYYHTKGMDEKALVYANKQKEILDNYLKSQLEYYNTKEYTHKIIIGCIDIVIYVIDAFRQLGNFDIANEYANVLELLRTDGTIENPEKVVESIIEMSSSKVFSKLN